MSGNGTDLLARMTSLLEALNCGAALIDRAGILVHVNHRLCAMMRRECSAVKGKNILSFYEDEKDRATLADGLENFEASSESEFYLPLPDGQRLPVISSSRNLP